MSYQLIESYLHHDGVVTSTYGISCLQERVEDVSIDREEVCDLILSYNTMELDPKLLKNVIEDHLLRQCNRYG